MALATAFPERHWYRRSALSLALWPLSLAFGAGVAIRRGLYRHGLFTQTRLPVPVVVVGNLVVGGAGKTPLTLWLARALAARGRRPGIVSRGFGGTDAGPSEVPPGGDWRRYGDEPVLMAEAVAAPVWIGRRRAAAAQALLAAHPDCDVVLCDDGLQHYALARDVELAVVDARGAGNGFLLPAGPLREPAARAVDAVVGHGTPGRFAMRLEPSGFSRVSRPDQAVPLEALRGRRLHAVAGIGHPQRFFDSLAALGLAFTPHAFPDHHAFVPADLEFAACDAVLMTAKDAVKCRAFGRDDLVALAVAARVDEALADFVIDRIAWTRSSSTSSSARSARGR
jgi:tetraacyldisaccharide 4'-kinase